MPLKAVLMDYGNTLLLDPFKNILNFIRNDISELLRMEDIPIRVDRFLKEWERANSVLHRKFFSHFYQEEDIIEYIFIRCGLSVERKLIREILEIYRREFRKIVSLDKRIQKIREVLNVLKSKNLKLGVVSNERSAYLRLAIHIMGLSDILDVVLASEDIGIEKPDPRIFLHALRLLGCKAKESAYVGDDPLRDIKPAKELGMVAILYLPPEHYRESSAWRSYEEHHADYVLNDLIYLPFIIEELKE